MPSLHALKAPSRGQSFSVVFAIELWERFGYYGMQAVLLLYLVQHLGLDDYSANTMIGAFVGLMYILPVLGGYVGDRLLGPRRAMLFGAVILMVSYAALVVAHGRRAWFIFALALIPAGNGLFKPNAGNLVRRIFEGDDEALDGAFTLYYMSVNIGSTVSMLLTPWLQDRYGSTCAFATCSIGLAVGITYFFFGRRWLWHVSSPLETRPLALKPFSIVAAGVAVMVLFTLALLTYPALARASVWVTMGLIVVAWVRLYRRSDQVARPGLRLTFLLSAQIVAYLIFYQQEMTSLTLFSLRAVDGAVRFGHITLWQLSPAQYQALNPLWVVLLSPILAWLYRRVSQRGYDFSIAKKLVIGFALTSIGFFIWWQAAALTHGLVSAWVMIIGYGFISLAELLTMAMGLVIIARYTAPELSGFMMGSLYLSWGIAMYCGAIIANLAAIPSAALIGPDPGRLYAPLFRDLFFTGLGLTILFCGFLPLVSRWEKDFAALRAR